MRSNARPGHTNLFHQANVCVMRMMQPWKPGPRRSCPSLAPTCSISRLSSVRVHHGNMGHSAAAYLLRCSFETEVIPAIPHLPPLPLLPALRFFSFPLIISCQPMYLFLHRLYRGCANRQLYVRERKPNERVTRDPNSSQDLPSVVRFPLGGPCLFLGRFYPVS